MFPALTNSAAAGYKGPVKKELLKGVGLLNKLSMLRKRKSLMKAGVFSMFIQFSERNKKKTTTDKMAVNKFKVLTFHEYS